MTKQGLVTHQVGEANFGHLNICLAGSARQGWLPVRAGEKVRAPVLAGPAGLPACWAALSSVHTIIDTPLLLILVFTHVRLQSSCLFDHHLSDNYSREY